MSQSTTSTQSVADQQIVVNERSQTTSIVIQLALFIFAFYFFLIRPQQKKDKLKQEKVSVLKKGQSILINSGLIGKFVRFTQDDKIIVEIATGIEVIFLKSAFVDVILVDNNLIDSKNSEDKKKFKKGYKHQEENFEEKQEAKQEENIKDNSI